MTVQMAFQIVRLTIDSEYKDDWQTTSGERFSGWLVRRVSTISGNITIQIGTTQILRDVASATVLPGQHIGCYIDPTSPDLI